MRCVILDNVDTALQAEWQRRLVRRLRRQGHEPAVVPGTGWLHDQSLRTVLRGVRDVAGRLAIWESDTWPLDARWGAWVDEAFDRDDRLGCVAAQHGWLRFPRAVAHDVVRPGDARHVGRQWAPLPDNAAAWWCVFDLGRLRAAGLDVGDLDWSPTGFAVRLDGGRSIGATGGDTGARVVGQLAAAGLRAELWPVRPWHDGFGVHVVRALDGVATEEWVLFHLMHGREIGKTGTKDVLHHRLLREDVTDQALRFMEGQM